MGAHYTHGGDHFTLYTDNESRHCTLETNINFYVNYVSIKNARITVIARQPIEECK